MYVMMLSENRYPLGLAGGFDPIMRYGALGFPKSKTPPPMKNTARVTLYGSIGFAA